MKPMTPYKDDEKFLARWETRGKRCWYELFQHPKYGYSYGGDNCGGSVIADNKEQAIEYMEKIINQAKRIDKINYRRVF